MAMVSIIVPYYKGQVYLKECIQSIVEQKYEDYEIILVDERFGDNIPLELLDNEQIVYVNPEKEVEDWVIRRTTPFGVATSRNVGIRRATGKYIYFLDSDDYLLEDALKPLVELAEEKDALFVTGNKANSWFRPASFDWERAKKESNLEGVGRLEGEFLENRFSVNFSAQGILLRRDFILEKKLEFYRSNVFFSDIYFTVVALSAALSEGRAWFDGGSYYIWRQHNDPVHLPALHQRERKCRSFEYIHSYEYADRMIQEGQTELHHALDRQLCNTILDRFPDFLRGMTANQFAEALNQITDKSIVNEYSFFNKHILKLFMKKRYRSAIPFVAARKFWRKKNGLFGSKIQYYRFLGKILFDDFPVKKNWVFFESFYGKGYADSPKYLYEYLLENYGNRYRYIWCLNQKSDMVQGNPKIVKRFSLRYIYYVTRCKYQIYNTRQPQWLEKRDDMVFLETWHGTPLKKLVFDLDDIHAVSQNHKKVFYEQCGDWDYLISANPFSTDVFERAFSFPRERILESGYPRNDILYSKNKDDIAKKVRNDLAIPEDKKVILYVPTWRDNQYYGKGKYKFSMKLNLKMMMKELGDEYVLLLRTHYYIADQINLKNYRDFVINGSDYEDISLLYLVSDLCITDYSSAFFDYANLKRPILFYVYDYEDYKNEIRGLYIDMEKDLPGPVVQTNKELIGAIKHLNKISEEYQERYDKFYKRFCSIDDGNACQRVIREVFK